MNLKRSITTATLAIGLLAGGSLAAAAPAQAGTTIGTAVNAKTHIKYTYYASTDQFCISKASGAPHTIGVRFYNSSGTRLGTLSWYDSGTRACLNLKKAFGVKEDAKLKFTLFNSAGKTSSGSLKV